MNTTKTTTQRTQYLYGNPGNPFQLTASRATDNTLTTYSYDTSGNLFAFERAGTRYYVATDHLGTPKVVTYDNGTIVKQAEYDAWGVKLSDSAPAFDLPVGFAGGIPEALTGLVRFGFRDYEPGTGRWVAKDPILFEGGQGNLYAYVYNSPTILVDRKGTFVGQLIGGGIGSAFGAYAAYHSGNRDVYSLMKGAAVGFGAGVLSTIPIPGFNPLVSSMIMGGVGGGFGNLAFQVFLPNGCSNDIDIASVEKSIGIGMFGGFMGNVMVSFQSPQGIQILTEYGEKVVGSFVSSVSSGYVDAVFH